ncbi:hypothetical protein D3C73_1403370 [compost metagenome]
MAFGTDNVTVTMIGPTAFGNRWRNNRRPWPAPIEREASTYSRFFSCIISPRTIHDMLIHPVIVKARIIVPKLGSITTSKRIVTSR